MNLDLDLSVVSRFFRGLVSEFRQKKLWPVAVALLAAVVAIPVVLSKSATPAPQPLAQAPTPPPAGASIPALSVQTTPSHSHLTGAGHDPFGGVAAASASPSATTTTVATAVSRAVSTLSGGANPTTATGSTTGSTNTTSANTTATSTTGSSTGTTSSSPPPSITGNAKPKPAPTGLKPTQAYDVAMAITNSKGGIDTVDPLERDSTIPSDQQPLLVELGVAQGGNRVLFAVQPGTVPSGPGVCTPGPIDCEVLSLGQDQTEQLSSQQGSIGTSQAALFAITSVSATDYPTSAAADKARRASSPVGRGLLAKDSFPTLSLFQYEPSLGSVVDLRNLKIGG